MIIYRSSDSEGTSVNQSGTASIPLSDGSGILKISYIELTALQAKASEMVFRNSDDMPSTFLAKIIETIDTEEEKDEESS